MKKNKLVLLFGTLIAFIVIFVVLIGVRSLYCKVTYICQDGCKHTAWYRKGEFATQDMIYDAHGAEYEEGAFFGLYIDSACLLYYFDEPLERNSQKLYVSDWKESDGLRITISNLHTATMILLDHEDTNFVKIIQEHFEAIGIASDEYVYRILNDIPAHDSKFVNFSGVEVYFTHYYYALLGSSYYGYNENGREYLIAIPKGNT